MMNIRSCPRRLWSVLISLGMEKLQPKNMIKNKRLSHSISQISWSKIVDMIKYKADWYDKLVIQVDRFFPSSKLFNNCGYKHEDLTLDIRRWNLSRMRSSP